MGRGVAFLYAKGGPSSGTGQVLVRTVTNSLISHCLEGINNDDGGDWDDEWGSSTRDFAWQAILAQRSKYLLVGAPLGKGRWGSCSAGHK